MLKVLLDSARDKPLRVLCLGAHSDDIEIGCGGTILRLLSEYTDVEMRWIVFGARDIRAKEARDSAEAFLQNAKESQIVVKGYRDGYFPYIGDEIKDYFEQLKEEFSPDLIFTHYRNDLHQDHRLINELTWNTYRNHLILEYEIPKYDGDFGTPNFFILLDEATCSRKIKYLLEHFGTQRDRRWFTEDAFRALLRLRGIESQALSKFAEAFYVRKTVL